MNIIQHPQFLKQIAGANILCSKRNLNRLYLTLHGETIKIFYARGYFFKARRRVKRFLKNSRRLLTYGVRSVKIARIEEYKEYKAIAVYYPFIPGKTALEWYQATQQIEFLYLTIEKLFLLQMHGIYFSDFHGDNILFDSSMNYSLLDIHNLRFYRKPLSLRRCCHNLATCFTYREKEFIFSEEKIKSILQKYFELLSINPNLNKKMEIAVRTLMKFYIERRLRGKMSNTLFKLWWWVKPTNLQGKISVVMLRFFSLK